MAATPDWIGKYAEVKDPGTPGWSPEGTVTYPEGVGGFIVRSDDRGRPVVRLSHYYGKSNRNLVEYGEVAFEMETSTSQTALGPGEKTTARNENLSTDGLTPEEGMPD